MPGDHRPKVRALSESELRAWKKVLEEQGRPLLEMLPIRHRGFELQPPAYECANCDYPLGYRYWRGVLTSKAHGRPSRISDLVLFAGATCPVCGGFTVNQTRFPWAQDEPAPPAPKVAHWFDLVSLGHKISQARGESDADRASPLHTRLWRRILSKPFQWPALAVIGVVLWLFAMPRHLDAWGWMSAWETLQAVTPSAYVLWLLYEIGVLWASHAPASRYSDG